MLSCGSMTVCDVGSRLWRTFLIVASIDKYLSVGTCFYKKNNKGAMPFVQVSPLRRICQFMQQSEKSFKQKASDVTNSQY